MKPIRLEMEHFGPYRDKAEVDFRALRSLFLVWGPTGAGKSTLFDAMAYALYGELPGARGGQERQLVSHHAEIGKEPRVTFEFSLGGDVFKVERMPPYSRPKRGGGMTETPARAVLYAKSGAEWRVEADKVRDVTAYVERRICLSFEEFSKIILLPQGEFEEFLKMDAGSRADVLEKLFPVALHDSVTALAAAQAQAFGARADALAAEEARLARDSGEDPGARLSELSARADEARALLDSALAECSARETALELARSRAARIARARDAEAALARLRDGQGAQAARLRRIESARAAARIRPLEDQAKKAAAEAQAAAKLLEARKSELAGLGARREAIVALKDALPVKKAEGERASNAIALLEKARDAWEGALRAKTALEAAVAEVARREAEVVAGRAALAELQAEYARVAVPLGEERAAKRAAEEAKERAIAAKAAVEAHDAWRDLSRVVAERESAVREAEAARHAAAALFEAARRKLDTAERSMEFAHAQRLAATLVKGKPCPVCGSTSHPEPALSMEADSGEAPALKDAQAEYKKALERDASTSEALNAARTRQEEAIEALGRFEAARAESGGLPASGDEAARILRDADKGHEAAVTALAEMEARRDRAAMLRERIESVRAGQESLVAALEQARVAAGRAESALESARAHSGGEDPRAKLDAAVAALEGLQSALDADERQVDAWERAMNAAILMEREASRRAEETRAAAAEALESARRAAAAEPALCDQSLEAAYVERSALAALERDADEFARALSAAESRYAALKADLPAEGQSEPDIAALESLLAAARAAAEARSRERDEALRAHDALAALLLRMDEVRAERRALDAEAGTMLDLARLLKGDIKGRHLPFKNFALAMYFRQVVAHASTRLTEMSDGRYALKADEGQSSGRGRIGLGISVLDSYTGLARPTQTLSGGERFLASVSLALGLADTIRMRAGGVSLEAVFIDEGFGSLDDSSLDRAITVLDRIRGDRTIGIVSHVAELRSRIASRIEVSKGASGSTLRVV